MSEIIISLINSNNLIQILIGIFLFLIIFIALSATGIVSFRGYGLNIGKKVKSDSAVYHSRERYILLTQSYFLGSFLKDLEAQVKVKMSNLSVREASADSIDAVFTKVETIITRWLLLNNISETEHYIKSKTDQLTFEVDSEISKINPIAYKNQKYMEFINNTIKENVPKLIKEFLYIRNREINPENL